MSDGTTASGGVPDSVAAIMAAIRAAVTAPAVTGGAGDGPPPRPAVPLAMPEAYRGEAGPVLPPGIDAEVRALLAPMLRAWLDAHLPEIVEAATRSEIRRLTGLND